jgi:hypothetical protein
MVFEVHSMLMGILKAVDDTSCDDRILNGLVCFLFEILGEEGIGLNGGSHVQ